MAKLNKTFTIVSLSILAAFICSLALWTILLKPNVSSAKLAYTATSLDALSEDCELIVRVNTTDNIKNITYSDVDFTLTGVNVLEVIKGNTTLEGKTIKLFQTKGMKEDPRLKSNQELLLFLYQYEGPVTKDICYVSLGLYQGMYKLANKQLTPLYEKEDEISTLISEKRNILTSLKNKYQTE